MIALSSLRAASRVILDSGARATPGQPASSRTEAMLKTGTAGASAGSADAQSVFNPTRFDVTKMKVQLMERVGQAFGLDLEDFDSLGSMAEVIEYALSLLDQRAISAIEKDLGLDDLGVSLRDVTDAMKDPGGSGDKRLEAALLKERGVSGDKASASPPPLDDPGLYGYVRH